MFILKFQFILNYFNLFQFISIYIKLKFKTNIVNVTYRIKDLISSRLKMRYKIVYRYDGNLLLSVWLDGINPPVLGSSSNRSDISSLIHTSSYEAVIFPLIVFVVAVVVVAIVVAVEDEAVDVVG